MIREILPEVIDIKFLLGYNLNKKMIGEGGCIPIERNTIQKSLILETVKKLHCHPTADEVYAAVAEKYPHISRATVYRNLKRLAEIGEICEIETPGSADHFDYQLHGHYHIRCMKCGKVFDVEMDYIPDLEKSIKNAHGFQISGHDLMFKGICPVCGAGQ